MMKDHAAEWQSVQDSCLFQETLHQKRWFVKNIINDDDSMIKMVA